MSSENKKDGNCGHAEVETDNRMVNYSESGKEE
jgi:hypothetical protein